MYTKGNYPVDDMKQMRNAGATYQKIADKYGISKQAVYQRLKSSNNPRRNYKKCVKLKNDWPILEAFLCENDMTISMLSDKCGMKKSRMYSCLYGSTKFRKREADCIARVVGPEFLNSEKFKSMR